MSPWDLWYYRWYWTIGGLCLYRWQFDPKYRIETVGTTTFGKLAPLGPMKHGGPDWGWDPQGRQWYGPYSSYTILGRAGELR